MHILCFCDVYEHICRFVSVLRNKICLYFFCGPTYILNPKKSTYFACFFMLFSCFQRSKKKVRSVICRRIVRDNAIPGDEFDIMFFYPCMYVKSCVGFGMIGPRIFEISCPQKFFSRFFCTKYPYQLPRKKYFWLFVSKKS